MKAADTRRRCENYNKLFPRGIRQRQAKRTQRGIANGERGRGSKGEEERGEGEIALGRIGGKGVSDRRATDDNARLVGVNAGNERIDELKSESDRIAVVEKS